MFACIYCLLVVAGTVQLLRTVCAIGFKAVWFINMNHVVLSCLAGFRAIQMLVRTTRKQ